MTQPPPPDPRAEALARFARLTGAPAINRIVQRGRDPHTARYTLHLAAGSEVPVGTIDTLWSQAGVAKVIAVACGVVIQRMKVADWHAVLAGLISEAVDVVEVDGEAFADDVREWALRYLTTASLLTSRDEAAAASRPYVNEGEVFISAGDLAKYIRREHHEQVALPEVRAALGDLGFERRTVMYQRTGRRASASYYVATDAFLEPPTDEQQ